MRYWCNNCKREAKTNSKKIVKCKLCKSQMIMKNTSNPQNKAKSKAKISNSPKYISKPESPPQYGYTEGIRYDNGKYFLKVNQINYPINANQGIPK